VATSTQLVVLVMALVQVVLLLCLAMVVSDLDQPLVVAVVQIMPHGVAVQGLLVLADGRRLIQTQIAYQCLLLVTQPALTILELVVVEATINAVLMVVVVVRMVVVVILLVVAVAAPPEAQVLLLWSGKNESTNF
jgi:hypothetical protein